MTNRVIHFIFVFATLSITACAKAEPPNPIYAKTLPNESAMPVTGIKPHSVRYKKTGATMNYRMSEVEVGGAARWLVEIDFNQGPDSKPDQIWLDKTSFAFRQRLLILSDYTIDVSMSDGLFSGDLVPAEGSNYTPVVYNKTYEHDAFEPAIINYAIAALPLAVKYSASIPVFDLNNGSEMFWSNIRVLSEETITIDGTKFDCWKVESNGIRDKTIWIGKDNLLAIKMKTKGNPGAWKIVPSSIQFH